MGLFSGIGKVLSSITGDGLLSGGLDLLGGVMSNNANSSEASANRAFQADQTGTAYQRAVADLKAAGLNPMLAYTQGGASSGGGAQATMQNAVGSAVHTGLSAKMNNAQVENLKSQNDAIKAQTLQSLTQSDLNRASTVAAAASARLSNASAGKVATDTLLSAASVPAARNAASAESSWMGRNLYPHFDRAMKSVNNLPVLNWFK